MKDNSKPLKINIRGTCNFNKKGYEGFANNYFVALEQCVWSQFMRNGWGVGGGFVPCQVTFRVWTFRFISLVIGRDRIPIKLVYSTINYMKTKLM